MRYTDHPMWTRAWLDDHVPGLRRVEEGYPCTVVLRVAWWRWCWPNARRRLQAFIDETSPVHVAVEVRYSWY